MSSLPQNDINRRQSSARRRRVRRLNYQKVFPTYEERLLKGIAYEFEILGHQLKRRSDPKDRQTLNNRRFRAAFGCCSKVCAIAWLLIVNGYIDHPKGAAIGGFFGH